MLKWLAGPRPRSPLADVVTDDPLAAIRVHQTVQRPLEIYAVSRVNPLFEDEVSAARGGQLAGSDSPNKSSSSGYGSPRYHSSSDYSSGTEEINGQRVYVGSRPASLRHDALSVLEQNVAFVKSILVAARRQRRRPPALTPIPEGNLDYAIPRPVWPRRPRRDAKPATPAVDDALVLYTSLTFPGPQLPPPPTEDVLRELSDTLSRGLDALRVSPTAALQTRGVDTASTTCHTAPGSSEGSPTARKPPASGPPPKESDDDTQPRESSSATTTSSRASSSGFSDATLGPTARTAVLYGGLRRARSPAGVYEHLRASGRGDKEASSGGDEQDRSLWGTYVGTGVVKGDVRLKAKDTKCYYPSLERPDFTLDAHSAERLMRRIKSAKRRRCWCRVATSLLGLLFFLLAVMAVSLLLTGGERIFGSL